MFGIGVILRWLPQCLLSLATYDVTPRDDGVCTSQRRLDIGYHHSVIIDTRACYRRRHTDVIHVDVGYIMSSVIITATMSDIEERYAIGRCYAEYTAADIYTSYAITCATGSLNVVG